MNEDLVSVLKYSWNVFDERSLLSPASQFALNIKTIKDFSIDWLVKKKAQDQKDIVDIELLLAESFNKLGFGFASDSDKLYLVELESKKRNILGVHEQEAKQKIRALWLLCGDDNTPFFHKYSNYRKDINSLWKIANDEGKVVEGFESIACAGVHHFETLFQEEKDLHLLEIVRSAGLFSSSISEEDNEDLMKEVTL